MTRFEMFIALTFLQFADFVSTWLFSLSGIAEGNNLLMAYRNGGTMLERVIAIKLLCLVIIANALLRTRRAGPTTRLLAKGIEKATRGRWIPDQMSFARGLCVWMLAVIGWNLLAAFSGAML